MKPIDFRNETWDSVRQRVAGLCMRVWIAWCQHGPGTTREVAARSGIDILNFRPRTTDLFQLGFVELTPEQPKKGEGIYRAVQWSDAKERFEANKRRAQTFQPDLFGSGPSRTGPALRSR